MANLEHIQDQRDEINKISSKYGAHRIRIFGSVARETAGIDSDVDFLIDLDPKRSLLDMGGLKMELQDLLGCKVDLVTEKGLHWFLKDKILEEARPL